MKLIIRSALLLAIAAVAVNGAAEDYADKDQIIVPCGSALTTIRLFDSAGKLKNTWFKVQVSNNVTTIPEDPVIAASQRYITTSLTTECVRGVSEQSMDGRAINVFRMHCANEPPLDIVVNAAEPATFIVVRKVKSEKGSVCVESDTLERANTIRQVARDEQVEIDVTLIARKDVIYHLGQIDLNELARTGEQPFDTDALRKRRAPFAGQGGSSEVTLNATDAKAKAPALLTKVVLHASTGP